METATDVVSAVANHLVESIRQTVTYRSEAISGIQSRIALMRPVIAASDNVNLMYELLRVLSQVEEAVQATKEQSNLLEGMRTLPGASAVGIVENLLGIYDRYMRMSFDIEKQNADIDSAIVLLEKSLELVHS